MTARWSLDILRGHLSDTSAVVGKYRRFVARNLFLSKWESGFFAAERP